MPPTDPLLYRLYESKCLEPSALCWTIEITTSHWSPRVVRSISAHFHSPATVLVVFGYPIKSVIHEKVRHSGTCYYVILLDPIDPVFIAQFGDGIMSAIDFRTSVDKVEEDGAERVKISLIGKWLPYKRF